MRNILLLSLVSLVLSQSTPQPPPQSSQPSQPSQPQAPPRAAPQAPPQVPPQIQPQTQTHQPQPEYDSDVPVGEHETTQDALDQYTQREINETKRMYDEILNYKHSQTFGLILEPFVESQYVFAVDVDEDMEIVMHSYMEQSDTYILANRTEGEEIKVSVYEDNKRLIGTWQFYHTRGMLFHAKKQHEYFMKVNSKGTTKMIVMNVEHFTYRGSSDHAIKKDTVKAHEVETQAMKEKLISFMRLAETNHVINELIAENVRLHLNRYMLFEVIEGLVIFLFALAQGYFIRRLLSKGYSIV